MGPARSAPQEDGKVDLAQAVSDGLHFANRKPKGEAQPWSPEGREVRWGPSLGIAKW